MNISTQLPVIPGYIYAQFVITLAFLISRYTQSVFREEAEGSPLAHAAALEISSSNYWTIVTTVQWVLSLPTIIASFYYWGIWGTIWLTYQTTRTSYYGRQAGARCFPRTRHQWQPE